MEKKAPDGLFGKLEVPPHCGGGFVNFLRVHPSLY